MTYGSVGVDGDTRTAKPSGAGALREGIGLGKCISVLQDRWCFHGGWARQRPSPDLSITGEIIRDYAGYTSPALAYINVDTQGVASCGSANRFRHSRVRTGTLPINHGSWDEEKVG